LKSLLNADQVRLCLAAFLRSLAYGAVGVLLGIYLSTIGWSVRGTGALLTAGLAGIAVATLATSLVADRAGRRRTLIVLALLSGAGAAGLALTRNPALLFVFAFAGLLNGLGRDRGPAYALEQAMLPATTTPERRTYVLAWYSMAHDAGLALGSLLAAAPALLRAHAGWQPLAAYQATWGLVACLLVLPISFYATATAELEAPPASARSVWPSVAPASKRRITGLAALMGMDSLGGGFLTSALVSYWFFRRFGLTEETLAVLFFAARAANAASHLAAAWLARRIGLLNTMVFTHIPSSLFLIAVPFAPSMGWAAALFLAREALVEMDVPTRQSYVLAVVQPGERAFASGVTTLTRNVAYAVAPVGAGAAMTELALASPLFLGAGVKIAYDLLLFFSFRRIKPPEEQARA
jgi:MFS family permease